LVKADEKVAQETGVSPATVRRDGQFADALEAIESAERGTELKESIRSGHSGLSREEVVAMAKLPEEERRSGRDGSIGRAQGAKGEEEKEERC